MTTSATAPVPTTPLPAIWGPAVRIVNSPDFGPFSVHAVHPACGGGFEAFPLDFTRAMRGGVAGFSGATLTDVVEGVRNF